MIYLNANRSAAYRWDGRAHQFEFFFFGGAGRWVKSDLLTGLFRKEAGSPAPEDWLERYAEDEGWQSVLDADFVRLRKAAEAACQEEETPCEPKTAPSGAAAANPGASAAPSSCSTDAAPSTSGSSTVLTRPSGSAPGCPAACGTAAPLAPAQAAPAAMVAFDYSGLDPRTADTLHAAERLIAEARRDYVVQLAQAVSIAHGALLPVAICDGHKMNHNQYSEKTFVQWCGSVGLGKDTAYRLLQVAALLKGSTPEEQAVLEAASPSLLYAAAKPSAPAELVQAVKEGDITTHKQYQELLAQLKAKDQALADEKAAHKAESLAFSEALADEQRLRQASDAARIEAESTVRGLQELCSGASKSEQAAIQRAEKAEQQLATTRDELRQQTGRVKELEARPIEVKGADPDDIARWRAEGTEAARAELDKARREAAALQDRLAELEAGPVGGDAVALARQAAAGVETILQGQFALLDALPYDTYEAAAAPFEALRDHLTTALELGRWPEQ